MAEQKKRIVVNAFEMTCIGHQSFDLWRHPSSRATEYNTIKYWTDLAKTLERGLFDAVFIADVVGIYDVYKNSAAPAIEGAAQVPVNDPATQISAMAAVTEHLGFGVTAAATFEQPYTLARRYASLDHLTEGRVGFNVVTSYLPSAAENQGLPTQIPHDERYEIADEFLDVCYKLWEGSWEDGAVIKDRERGIYADPSKVHPIGHKGKYFSVPGISLTEPSPQRTPVIFQAGASSRGQKFSGKHAEAVFISALRPDLTRVVTDRIRAAAEEQGRSRDDVKILAMLSVIVDETEEKAKAKYEDYKKYINLDSAQAIIGGWSGVDLSQFDEDEVLNYVQTESIQSFLTPFTCRRRTRSGPARPLLSTPPSAAWARSSLVTRFRLLTSLSAGSTRVAWTASTWLTTSPRVPSRTSSSTLFPSCRSAAATAPSTRATPCVRTSSVRATPRLLTATRLLSTAAHTWASLRLLTPRLARLLNKRCR